MHKKEDDRYMPDNAIMVAVWGEGSLTVHLWPYFERLEQQGILKVAAIASEQQGKVVFTFKGQNTTGGGTSQRYFPTGS